MGMSFYPKPGASGVAAPAGSTTAFTMPADCPQVRFIWKPTTPGGRGQFRIGKGAQTAVTTDHELVEGLPECFSKADATDGAVIGTGSLYFSCGTGD